MGVLSQGICILILRTFINERPGNALDSATSRFPTPKNLFFSAAKPTDQGEESVLLLLLLVVVVGGTISQSPMYSFLGCEKAKQLSQKGCEKTKALSQKGCGKVKTLSQ